MKLQAGLLFACISLISNNLLLVTATPITSSDLTARSDSHDFMTDIGDLIKLAIAKKTGMPIKSEDGIESKAKGQKNTELRGKSRKTKDAPKKSKGKGRGKSLSKKPTDERLQALLDKIAAIREKKKGQDALKSKAKEEKGRAKLDEIVAFISKLEAAKKARVEKEGKAKAGKETKKTVKETKKAVKETKKENKVDEKPAEQKEKDDKDKDKPSESKESQEKGGANAEVEKETKAAVEVKETEKKDGSHETQVHIEAKTENGQGQKVIEQTITSS